ncbi:MAG TPA: 5-(carboxyamino)imidazole ribonucleotide synthase, partial [Myxococcota bacterium]|nr:5-(carboxyamino)imidazole ribonucleotide synthase [Myxococcota bacterium]
GLFDAIPPGKTIGILGGGQLGRMFAIAARRMGYRVHALDPEPDGPTGQVADVEWSAPYDDVETARALARQVDVVTFEFENIPYETLQAVAELVPVHPGPLVLDTTRHRLREKTFLATHGFPVARHRAVASLDDLHEAVGALGTPSILKTATFGYDGKGQSKLLRPGDASLAWEALGKALGGTSGVLEAFVPFTRELSVVVARGIGGQLRCFEVAENTHVDHILDLSVVPANISPATRAAATELAIAIAKSLDLVGVLAVELFHVEDGTPTGKLIVNELAPRPHNSGHFSVDACLTSQFEQQLRAVCHLPLGDASLLRPAAMVNLLGDLWNSGDPQWSRALSDPGVKLHVYGKTEARPGRKMGHLTVLADTAEEATARALAARARLTPASS